MLKKMTETITVNKLLWLVYLALLGVLLPHTAWAFSQFESEGMKGLGVVGALAFEGAIAALTWRIKERIERTPKFTAGHVRWRKFGFRYGNAYGAGLLAATLVSAIANWSHAVEFGGQLGVFGKYSIPPLVYSLAFGGILPAIAILFTLVLAEDRGSEVEANPELETAKAAIRELRSQLKETERQRDDAEVRAKEAEVRFAAAGDLFAMLCSEEKRLRILAARQTWPALPASAIAVIADASQSYVSEVLKDDPQTR